MERFWVYLENRVQGPVEIPALRKLNGFNLLTQVCQEGQEAWRVADEVIEIKAYFSAPPRGSSLMPETQPELPSPIKNQIEIPLPSTMPQPARAALNVVETLPGMSPPVVVGNTVTQPSPAGDAIRVPCATCGYKNPRDVAVCMKCSTPLKTAGNPAESKPPISLSALADSPSPAQKKNVLPEKTAEAVIASVKVESLSDMVPPAASPMVEIPVTRIAIIVLSVSLTGAVFFMGRHMWKAKHHAAPSRPAVINSAPMPPAPAESRAPLKSRMHTRGHRVPRSTSTALPGVQQARERSAERGTRNAEVSTPIQENHLPSSAPRTPRSQTASYTVVNQAYPLQHRTSSPIDSKYAARRRGDHGLWSAREEEAIQQVQGYRIYGGQRTVRRNAEILMQILRDREYTSAFEEGKRLYLFNDADWAVSQKEGPVFEVRLTFSGGKQADGSSRTPLRFAFNADLERQTVEPGGSSAIKANTMHAFFDESRIPPEERRSVAKDTEDLVMAALPGASPLTLDNVTTRFAANYSMPALQRITDTYGLTLVHKKLNHETASVNDVIPEIKASEKTTSSPSAAQTKMIPTASASGAIQYTMEPGNGKERMVTAKAPSSATPAKLWETATSYDRLTQYIPDLLVSQREGQDGSAVIVHTVSLTRLMIFVFKMNLHLRILEHPQQHRLEFERIAGDFEKFSGYLEITPDATGTRSNINMHVTIAPKGYLPQWVLRDMAQKFLVPVLDAIRSKAESY